MPQTPTSTRPALTPRTVPADFRAFYWLKHELQAFCRDHGLSTAGSKIDIADRIEHFLQTGQTEPKDREPVRRARAALPQTLTVATRIGAGWRCTEALRAFFEDTVGSGFKFNGPMRDYIRDGAGKTLGDAVAFWNAEARRAKPAAEIAPQFEYNRHLRAYFEGHPGATRTEAIAAWKALRAARKP